MAIAFMGFALLVPSYAQATNRTDILVGLKTLPMLDNVLHSPLLVGIVYDPSNPESTADAEGIKSLLDAGVTTADFDSVSGVLVPLSAIDKLASVKFAFVAVGTRNGFDAIAKVASTNGVLTISTDLECARTNKCVLGITGRPVVEIYFSRAASEMSKIGFDPAFTMLVKKI